MVKYRMYILGIEFHGWKEYTGENIEQLYEYVQEWAGEKEFSIGKYVLVLLENGKMILYHAGDSQEILDRIRFVYENQNFVKEHKLDLTGY